MIHKVKIVNNKHTAVEWFDKVFKGKRTFSFSPGMNIIVGPNASGKSTLIKAIARMFMCENSGIPQVTEDSLRKIFQIRQENLPDGLAIEHDGSNTYYFSPELTPGVSCGGAAFDFSLGADGIAMFLHGNRSSSGQKVMMTINMVVDHAAKNIPIDFGEASHFNDLWQIRKEKVRSFLQGNGLKIKPTILFDEPERSMDISNHINTWNVFQRQKRFQIIAVSHSPLALLAKDATFIEIEKGYLQKCRQAMENAFGKQILPENA